MAFNFWEAQRRARSRTKLYLLLFIILTVALAVAVEVVMRHVAGPENYDPPLPLMGLFFGVVTVGSALFNYTMYQQYGGSYVAESVGGRRIDPGTEDFKERQLINIAKEMSLAAGVPMPAVYIVPAREINAFAAGLTPQKAAIAVTAGTLALLKRDELQGVVAHEFGHIYNGDMRIGLQLAAMVMGFFALLYIGFRIMQFSSLGRRNSEREENGERRGLNPILLAGLLSLAAGAVAWLFGALLKAAVSRQREYLADACAVQFTRQTDGIANALKKIEKQVKSDMPKSGMAFSHLYFDDKSAFSALFATHPPLEKRIAALESLSYLPPEWRKDLPQH